MKKTKLISIGTSIIVVLLALLFVYTATSKYLDYDKFVFQMRLAPIPLMKTFAPVLGWIMPSIEMLIAIGLAVGFFYPTLKIKALYSSVILLFIFETYIGVMLLSGSHLPCTCGGIISQMGWRQHLFFNAFFIITGVISIWWLKQKAPSFDDFYKQNPYKDLSRA